MPKKANEQKARARKLFEEDGLTLAEIAKVIDKPYSTVKTWKFRDNWVKNETETETKNETEVKTETKTVSKVRLKANEVSKAKPKSKDNKYKVSENSLANLNQEHKYPDFKPGNQQARIHGLYSKYLTPEANEIVDTVRDIDNLSKLNETIQIKFSNYIQAQNKIDLENPSHILAESQAGKVLANLITDYENLLSKVTDNQLKVEKLKSVELDNQLKEFELERKKAAQEGGSAVYKGLPIDAIAPVFAGLHYDIASNKYREFVLPGGRGSTKSSFISLEIINLIEKNPDIHCLVCRQIDNTLRDTVFNQLMWAIDTLGLNDEYRSTFKPLEITKNSTGQKIYFTGLSDPTSVKSFTPPFGYVGILWFEELDQIRGNETVRKVEQSIIRGGNTFYTFKSFNPPKSKNNWANLYVQEPKESMNVYFSTYLDVPQEWLGEPFIQEAEYLKKVNPEAYKNEYLGEANGSGGNVLPNIVTRTITDEEIASFDNIANGLDFGWIHPVFFVRAQYNVAQQQIIVFDEICKQYLPNKDLAELIKEHGILPKEPIVCDSAEPKSIRNLQDEGLRAVPAKKGQGSVEEGIKFLASQVEIVVDPKRTPNFYKQAINYEYERDKEGNITSLLPKIDDDGIDALRYALERFMYKRRSGVYAL